MSAAPRTAGGTAIAADVEAAICDLFERRLTFNQVLGLVADAHVAAGAGLRFEMRPELVGHYLYGRLHGGVIATALDAAAGFVLMLGVARKHPDDGVEQILARFARVGTIDLRIDYLRPGLGSRFHARAEITRLGGRIGSAQMRLENEAGVLIATGATSYIIS